MKRKIGMIASVVVFFVLGVALSAVQAEQKPIKLKWGSVMAAPGIAPMGDVAKSYQDEVTKRTNGAVTFESFWSASLGAPAEYIEMLKNGVVQVIQTHQWYTPSRMPLGEFEYVFPFGPTDAELVVKAMRQIRSEFPEFAKELSDNNAILLADPPQGAYYMLSTVPITSIADFKGKKVALVGRYFGREMPPGAVAVVRPAHERYDLLNSGVTQVNLDPWDNMYAFKLHEVTNYYLDNLSLLLACPMGIFMNLNTFKSLDPETQKIMLDAGKNVELRTATEILPQWLKKTQDLWRAKGIKWITFPDEEKVKWAATLEDIPAEWAADVEKLGLPGFKIVQRWQEITESLGYKWNRKWGVKK